MDAAHVHLLLNHVPVVGTMIGIVLLLAALGRGSDELKRASLAIFAAAALLTVSVAKSGERAEDAVEGLPGVSESVIEPHEEAAEAAAVAAYILGAVSLVGLLGWRRAVKLPQWLTVGTLVLSLVVGGLLARTANLGGQIRHSEIRTTATAARAMNDGPPAPGRQPERQHD